jgi:hypothetical protein
MTIEELADRLTERVVDDPEVQAFIRQRAEKDGVDYDPESTLGSGYETSVLHDILCRVGCNLAPYARPCVVEAQDDEAHPPSELQ